MNVLKASYDTNHLEVIVKPTRQKNIADYYVNLTGKTSSVVYTKPAVPSKVGMFVDWQAMEVTFANFEYEEIEP